MHQHPRPPPATASPATSPKTNPMRTNNPRDQDSHSSRSSSDKGAPADIAFGAPDTTEAENKMQRPASDGKGPVAKLNQVVQNFHTKAALLILSHRTTLSPALSRETNEKRVNKWFNVEVDETNDLLEALHTWKTSNIQSHRPPSMIIETFIDVGGVNGQSLILQDVSGHQWGVEDAIRSYIDNNRYGEKMPSNPRVVLERWRCQLGPQVNTLPDDLGAILPRVYKNSIVLFRSLFAYLKLLPAWELTKKPRDLTASQKVPKIKYRIYEDGRGPATDFTVFDELEIALDDARSPVTDSYAFEPIDSPAGFFSVEVTYRRKCDFRVEKSMESVYSSRFIGQDEDLFKPSLDRFASRDGMRSKDSPSRQADVGSLPQGRRELAELADQGQAYGSLSTFHGAGARVSSSPLSALRAAREMNAPPSEESSPAGGQQERQPVQGSSYSSFRSNQAGPPMARRTSVSFMPFKSPSLSASPLQTDTLSTPGQRTSIGRASALTALAEARKPSTAQATSIARGSPVQPETHPAASIASSPRPTPSSRYSSSFGHRRARLSVGGSKTEDDNNSSGKASVSSSTAQPGSGVLAETGNASSGSLNTDDDNISDFLKMLDQKKDLKSFQTPTEASSGDISTRRTSAALSKFHRLKDTNAALTDSLASSIQYNRSSSSSSHTGRLANVPPMMTGNSISTGSSPGERMSPRTPHTPAIPSRLSANSIIEYNNRDRGVGRGGVPEEEETRVVAREAGLVPSRGTGAIDIPTSPRTFHPSYRRSSSVAQQPRPLHLDDDLAEVPYGMRSASMGNGEERQPLSMSELLSLQETSGVGLPSTGTHPSRRPAQLESDNTMSRQRSSSSHEGRDDDLQGSSREAPYRPRLGRGSGRGSTSPQGTGKSFAGGPQSAGVVKSSDSRADRYSFARPSAKYDEEEEPLLFTMSDFGQTAGGQQGGRKSLEDNRQRGGPGNKRGGSSGWS